MRASQPHVRSGATDPARLVPTPVEGKAPTATTIVLITIVLGLLAFFVLRGL